MDNIQSDIMRELRAKTKAARVSSRHKVLDEEPESPVKAEDGEKQVSESNKPKPMAENTDIGEVRPEPEETPVDDVSVSVEVGVQSDDVVVEIPESDTGGVDPDKVIPAPEYTRERIVNEQPPDVEFRFRDVFIENEDGVVGYNADHDRTVARNLSKSIMNQVIDDLMVKHVDVQVSIGQNLYMITDNNAVFQSPTSLTRYLLLDGISDDDLSIQLARQLYLEKYPDGEMSTFKHRQVRTDERDIYAMVLSSKANPERNMIEKLDEIYMRMNQNDEALAKINAKVLKNTESSNTTLGGLNVATSLLVLERLGLTEGQIPRDIESMRAFTTQDSVVKFSDMLVNDIAMDVMRRKEVITRSKRANNSRSARGSRVSTRSIRR